MCFYTRALKSPHWYKYIFNLSSVPQVVLFTCHRQEKITEEPNPRLLGVLISLEWYQWDSVSILLTTNTKHFPLAYSKKLDYPHKLVNLIEIGPWSLHQHFINYLTQIIYNYLYFFCLQTSVKWVNYQYKLLLFHLHFLLGKQMYLPVTWWFTLEILFIVQ